MPRLDLPYPLRQSVPAYTSPPIPGWTHVGNSGAEYIDTAIAEYAEYVDDDAILTARPFSPDEDTRFAVYRRNDQ